MVNLMNNAEPSTDFIPIRQIDKKLPLIKAQLLKQLEDRYCVKYQIPSYQLMQRAGESAWALIQKHYPKSNNVVVVVGPGNNGGDGLEVASLAHQAGRAVTILCSFDPLKHPMQGDAAIAFEKANKYGVPFKAYHHQDLANADLIVDALLGTGACAPARPNMSEIINAINQSQKPIFSLDIPSGLEADTGCQIDTAVNATNTLSFIALKPGLVTADGKDLCGQLFLATLNFKSEDLYDKNSHRPSFLAHNSQLSCCFAHRRQNSHKGDYGRVLIIGGNIGMGGAVLLASRAACRSGAGAVSLITRPEHVFAALVHTPEVMVIGALDSDNIQANDAIAKASAIVIGPGLGKDDWAQFWLTKILSLKKPTIVDADGLTLAKDLKLDLKHCVITPHPGEAAYLLETSTAKIQQQRYQVSMELQSKMAKIVILKGSGSLICDGTTIHVCPHGNPAMATAGMGDVLAGIIGSFLAQSEMPNPAFAGMMLHSMAADLATKAHPSGLIASDVIEKIPEALQIIMTKPSRRNPI